MGELKTAGKSFHPCLEASAHSARKPYSKKKFANTGFQAEQNYRAMLPHNEPMLLSKTKLLGSAARAHGIFNPCDGAN